jgi:ribosome-associated toxin RatA of RatAB toxin-antitoxin module
MKQVQRELVIKARPERVSRLVTDIEAWASLLPHVRNVSLSGDGRWELVCVWRWMPFVVHAAARGDHVALEYRFQRWPRIRVSWQWAIHAATDAATSVHLTGRVVRAPALCSWLVTAINRDLADQTLQMIQLLAEADEIAHKGIER